MKCSCGRRHLILGSAAALFAPAAAQAAARPRRIDVHHHIVPPTWVQAVRKAKLDNPPMTNWTPAKSLEDMDKAGTTTAITSPMPPQVGFLPPADAARIARESNEWARTLAADHPGRFGVFGTDFPYRTGAEHVAGLAKRFSQRNLTAIDSGNVLRILPKGF